MKILLLSPLPPPSGGIAIWTQQYLEYMAGLGHEVDLVDISVQGRRAKNYTKMNVLEELLRTGKILFRTVSLLMKRKYDVVHFNTSCSRKGIVRDNIIARTIGLFHGNLLLHCRCNLCYALRIKRSKKCFASMLKASKKCIVLNRISQDFVRTNFGVETELMPNFISADLVDQNKKEIRPTVTRMLYVGHLLPTKGCDIIIEAAKSFPEIEFRLVGHIGEKIASLEKTDNVVFTGEQGHDKVFEEYRDADVLLFPTHTEGFPLTITEAMASGMPIITTRVGAIGDMLEEKGALYIEVNDCEGLKNAIIAISDASLRAEMSEFNKQKVLSEYTIDKVIHKLCEIYQTI